MPTKTAKPIETDSATKCAVDGTFSTLASLVDRERQHNNELAARAAMLRQSGNQRVRALRRLLLDTENPLEGEERQRVADEYADACAGRSLADASLGTAFTLGKRLT